MGLEVCHSEMEQSEHGWVEMVVVEHVCIDFQLVGCGRWCQGIVVGFIAGVRAIVVVPVAEAVGLALDGVYGFGVWLVELGSVCIWYQSSEHAALDKVVEARCQHWNT